MYVLLGSSVAEGNAQFLVLAVGLNSQTGTIMQQMGVAKEELEQSAKHGELTRSKSVDMKTSKLNLLESKRVLDFLERIILVLNLSISLNLKIRA